MYIECCSNCLHNAVCYKCVDDSDRMKKIDCDDFLSGLCYDVIEDTSDILFDDELDNYDKLEQIMHIFKGDRGR